MPQDGGQEDAGRGQVRSVQPLLWKRRKKKEKEPPSNLKIRVQKVKEMATVQCEPWI